DDRISGDQIPWGARALKIATDFDVLETQGMPAQTALDTMRGRLSWYDAEMYAAFAAIVDTPEQIESIRELALSDVVPGMTFVEDVRSKTGIMVIARGTEVTAHLSDHIKSHADTGSVVVPVRVRVAPPAPTRRA